MPHASDAAAAPGIERARLEDARALADIAAEALPEAWTEAGFEAELGDPIARVWVARDAGGDPVGYLAAHAVGGEIQVLSLAVSVSWRRRGVGRRLVAHALASEAEACVAHLEVRSDDGGARAFYEEMGFRAVGRRRRFYRDGTDALTMSRSLATDDRCWMPPRG